jgi:hypothetical protein
MRRPPPPEDEKDCALGIKRNRTKEKSVQGGKRSAQLQGGERGRGGEGGGRAAACDASFVLVRERFSQKYLKN